LKDMLKYPVPIQQTPFATEFIRVQAKVYAAHSREKREKILRSMVTRKFQIALVEQFNERFGEDANDLTTWKMLCAVLHIHPIPDTLPEAKKVRAINRQSDNIDLNG